MISALGLAARPDLHQLLPRLAVPGIARLAEVAFGFDHDRVTPCHGEQLAVRTERRPVDAAAVLEISESILGLEGADLYAVVVGARIGDEQVGHAPPANRTTS